MRMLARKLPFYALTFVIAITIDFFIPRLMPGNALDAVLAKAGSQMGSPQALHALSPEMAAPIVDAYAVAR